MEPQKVVPHNQVRCLCPKMDPNKNAPDEVLPVGDPGDETARRYRYQWTYAAVVCCMLLDETEDLAEVLCEQHEDILLKHSDATFTGVQVKTRSSDQDPWKTSDEGVRGACARFAKLESAFPGKFRSFRFLTNHPLHAAANGKDLRHVLNILKTNDLATGYPGPVTQFVTRIATDAGCSPVTVAKALAKTIAADDLPKIADVEARLVMTLCQVWAPAHECAHETVLRAARELSFECGQASSLAHQDVLPAYVPCMTDPENTEVSVRIAYKRINRSRVLRSLEQGVLRTAALDGDVGTCTEPGSGSTALLLKKLDAGGFSAVSRNSAVDLRDKADYLGMVWLKKFGRVPGLQRYTHVRSVVLSDAATAFEASRTDERQFGLDMLSQLRLGIRRRRAEGNQVYDCSNEHLEGFSYSLTSECKVQWSLDRPWEGE